MFTTTRNIAALHRCVDQTSIVGLDSKGNSVTNSSGWALKGCPLQINSKSQSETFQTSQIPRTDHHNRY